MAPALRIPVALDMNALRQQGKQASDYVGETLRVVGRAFRDANGEMLGIATGTASAMAFTWAQSAASVALKLSLMAAAGVEAYKLLGAAVEQARQDLEAMVEIADKARNSNVSPEFYQKFISQSQKLQVSSDELKTALDNAFQATKTKLNEGWLVTDDTKNKVDEITTAVRSLSFELFTVDHQSNGAQLFKDATTQEQKIRAVLVLMTELNAMGEKAVSLNLAEKLFGSQTADRMRQGRISAEGMLDAIDKSASLSDGVFSTAMVQRAKDVDNQLVLAHQRLTQDLKPSFETIESIVLSIRSAWAAIVGLMADAVETINKLRPGSATSGVSAALTDAETSLKTRLRDTGLTQQQRGGLEDQLRAIQSQILQQQLKAGTFDLVATGTGNERTGGEVPLPRVRPANAPGPSDTDKGSTRDRFDSSADSIEKRTAALNAETANIDLNTQARERAKVVAELETVAKQANAAAGLGENVITAEQRDRINEVADGYARAAAAIEQARSPLATFARESQNVGKQLNQFAASSLDTVTNSLADVVTGTAKAADAFKSMAQSIINDLAKIAIRQAITGPLARGLFGFLPGFDVGGFTGGASSAAVAGVVHGREYVFDAESTQRIGVPALEALRKGIRGYQSGGYVGNVVPAMPSDGGAGGGGLIVTIPVSIDARGADQAAVARIGNGLDQLQKTLPKQIAATVKKQRVRGTV